MLYTTLWCLEINTLAIIVFLSYEGEKLGYKYYSSPFSGALIGLNTRFCKLLLTKGTQYELVR